MIEKFNMSAELRDGVIDRNGLIVTTQARVCVEIVEFFLAPKLW